MYGVFMTLGFIGMTLLSVTLYANRLSPKDAFVEL
jgi:multidrug transporter EmrE-like cation transporter